MARPQFTFGQPGFPGIPSSWFNEPENHARKWKVSFNGDLAYNQRLAVSMRAEFPVPKLELRKGTLYFIARLAGGSGRFFPGYDYASLDLRTLPPRSDRINWHTQIFVRAGTYQAMLLVYDIGNNQHYLWRQTVTVEEPKVLPELDRNMPAVEFVDREQHPIPTNEYLPIDVKRPLRIDVVLNLTNDMQMSVEPTFFSRLRQYSVEGALQGSVVMLSQLQPDNGCVRVSAVDIIHLQVALDQAPADPNTNWTAVRETLNKNRDAITVDVKTLEGRHKAREFFSRFIDKVVSDTSGCGSLAEHTDRAFIIVSDSLLFPNHSYEEPLSAPAQVGHKFFHFRVTSHSIPTWDQVARMLSPLHPRRFEIDSPMDLRKAVAKMIEDLEGAVKE